MHHVGHGVTRRVDRRAHVRGAVDRVGFGGNRIGFGGQGGIRGILRSFRVSGRVGGSRHEFVVTRLVDGVGPTVVPRLGRARLSGIVIVVAAIADTIKGTEIEEQRALAKARKHRRGHQTQDSSHR